MRSTDGDAAQGRAYLSRRDDRGRVLATARELLDDTERWLPVLGRLALENTVADLQRPSTAAEAG